jgi:hypothetical protein
LLLPPRSRGASAVALMERGRRQGYVLQMSASIYEGRINPILHLCYVYVRRARVCEGLALSSLSDVFSASGMTVSASIGLRIR